MGLFHKTLEDIYNRSQKGNFVEAKKILDHHIETEHRFQSDLSGLQGALNTYIHELRELQQTSAELLSRKTPSKEGLQTLFQTKTYNARIQLTRIEALIMKLRKDARLELR